MDDYVIADIAVHLAASKNLQYRQNTILWYQTLARFLQDNGLSVRPFLEPNQTPEPPFKIMRSDLTEEGNMLIKAALHKWLKGLGAGKWLPNDGTLLLKELAKLRELEQK